MLTRRSGQTLLELILAIGVITTATLATTTLIVSTIYNGRVSALRIAAVNFAREGVEVVRGIRDSNWLKIDQNVQKSGALVTWDDDGATTQKLGGDATNPVRYYYASFQLATGLTLSLCPVGNPVGSSPCTSQLVICYNTAGGYYTQKAAGCSGGDASTNFQRTIKITRKFQATSEADNINFQGTNLQADYLDVEVTVSSPNDKVFKSVVTEERLYNWK